MSKPKRMSVPVHPKLRSHTGRAHPRPDAHQQQMAKTTPIDEALAAYLVGWGVLNKGELGRVNKSNETVEIAQEAWDLFQRGQVWVVQIIHLGV